MDFRCKPFNSRELEKLDIDSAKLLATQLSSGIIAMGQIWTVVSLKS